MHLRHSAAFACGDFTVFEELVDHFNVRDEHASATISFHSELVEDFGRVLSLLSAARIFLPAITDHLSAREASYGNDHRAFNSYGLAV